MKKRKLKTWVKVALCAVAIVATYFVAQPRIAKYEAYMVHSGDTLWSIAKQSNGYGRIDAYTIIDDIKEASNIVCDINVGDTVQIPMYN